jgi:DNA-binding CsgD family transcriptional regulator
MKKLQITQPAVRGSAWTEQEEAYLRANYELKTAVEMVRDLKRSADAIYARAAKLGLTMDRRERNRELSKKELEYLKRSVGKLRWKEIAGRLDISVAKAQRIVAKHGWYVSRKPRSWTAREENRLRQLLQRYEIKEIAAQLERTPKAIESRMRVLGLYSLVGKHRWTLAEDARLKMLYGLYIGKELAVKLNRPFSTVRTRIRILGLAKQQRKK